MGVDDEESVFATNAIVHIIAVVFTAILEQWPVSDFARHNYI